MFSLSSLKPHRTMSKAVKRFVYPLFVAAFIATAAALAPPTSANGTLCIVQAGQVNGEFVCFDAGCQTGVCCLTVCDPE